MISRRNIRVKVMQTLYSAETAQGEMKPGEALKILQKHFDQSKELLVYLTWFLSEVAGYAEKDSYIRSSKHLPSTEDLNVNTKISGNEVIWKIREDPSFQLETGRSKPEGIVDKELVRRTYQQLVESTEYKQYIAAGERNTKDEKEILEYILNEMMLNSEVKRNVGNGAFGGVGGGGNATTSLGISGQTRAFRVMITGC